MQDLTNDEKVVWLKEKKDIQEHIKGTGFEIAKLLMNLYARQENIKIDYTIHSLDKRKSVQASTL